MQIFQLTDVDEMLAFDHAAEELVVSGSIGLYIVESKIFTFGAVGKFTL